MILQFCSRCLCVIGRTQSLICMSVFSSLCSFCFALWSSVLRCAAQFMMRNKLYRCGQKWPTMKIVIPQNLLNIFYVSIFDHLVIALTLALARVPACVPWVSGRGLWLSIYTDVHAAVTCLLTHSMSKYSVAALLTSRHAWVRPRRCHVSIVAFHAKVQVVCVIIAAASLTSRHTWLCPRRPTRLLLHSIPKYRSSVP